MNEQFEIIFVSETEYEYLAVEVLFCGQRLCQINKEKGNEKMEIAFLTDTYILQKNITMKFSVMDFEKVLSRAKEELKLCE